MKESGIFAKVRFLESRLDRLEVIILEQDKVIRAQAKKIGEDYQSMLLEPSSRKMADIVADIASDNGLTLTELKSRSCLRAIAWPRQYAYSVLIDAGHSAASVGRFFGRDHSTVLDGARKAKSRGLSVNNDVDSAILSAPLLQSGGQNA